MGCRKYQAWNPKNRSWVMYEFGEKGFKPLDVKQHKPTVPFKGIPKRGRKR